MAQESAETRFAELMRLYGAPDGLLKWDSVEETGSGYIAHGFRIDLTGLQCQPHRGAAGRFRGDLLRRRERLCHGLAGRYPASRPTSPS